MNGAERMSDIIGAADIGGTTTKLGLFDSNEQLLHSWEIATDISEHGSHILENAARSLTEAGGDNRLIAVGTAVPGAVDEQGIARNCTNIALGTTDLKSEMGKLMPDAEILCFGNDATVAALGELKYGAGRNYSSCYLLTLGTGVGGGYAAKGEVVSGAFGAAGEVGHILINPHETSKCMCGRRGCLEQYASANGLVRLVNELLILQEMNQGECRHEDVRDRVHIEYLFDLNIPCKRSKLSEISGFTARDICMLAENKDELAAYSLQIFGRCLGLAMSSISCSIDPESYIIGGGMSKAGETVLAAIRKGYEEFAYPPSRDADIVCAELGNAAGIYGCAALVAEKLK